jgi:hypothetical protein
VGLAYGDIDGVGTTGQIAGGHYLTSDGVSLFISDYSLLHISKTVPVAPTIRQVELKTLGLTTMVGTRGQWTNLNGIGTQALVNTPGPIAFDATTHSLIFFDLAEGVVQKIR